MKKLQIIILTLWQDLKDSPSLISRQDWKTWPNCLSLTRISALPLLYIFLTYNNHWWLAFIVFLGGALTDVLDGFIARNCNQTTNLGKALDPLADKIFFLTTSYIIIPANFTWWWTIVLELESKLFTAGFIAFIQKGQGIFKLGANIHGKNKMITEMALVGELFLLKLGLIKYSPVVISILFAMVAIYAVLSIIGHINIPKKMNKP